mgnify:CR=1 FL=1
MTYELAKKLKEAGFPQIDMESGQREVWPLVCDPDEMSDKEWNEKCNDKSVYVPTLSELIEACEKKSLGVMFTNEFYEWNGWQALADVTSVNALSMGEVGADVEVKGSTLEEAVANLYLALNKPVDNR